MKLFPLLNVVSESKLGLFININGLNHHNQILTFLPSDLLWNGISGYTDKNRALDPQKLFPLNVELLSHWSKTYYMIQIHDVKKKKKLIPVTNRIYWYPSVCKIKTRELGIPDNWSATACNSVSQGKWRGGAGGKVRAELMNNSHCALNCCWVKNKLYYVKGNWRTHHRNDSVLLTPTLFQHAKCMQNRFFPLLSKFFMVFRITEQYSLLAGIITKLLFQLEFLVFYIISKKKHNFPPEGAGKLY